MKKQLTTLVAITALAAFAQADGGASTASSNGGSAASNAISASTLESMTTIVEISADASRALKINSPDSEGSSNASKNGSGSVVGEAQGSVASTGASVTPSVANVENVSIAKSTASTVAVEFELSNEQGFVRVSARNTSEASTSAINNVIEFTKNVSNGSAALSVAVLASGEVLLVKSGAASQTSSQGKLVEGSEMLLLAPSVASTAFSNTLDAELRARNVK